MNSQQFYIVVAIPLLGILCNTALFIHVSARVDRMAERMTDRIDNLATRVDALGQRLARVDRGL